jgi:hypothetical protein
MMFVTRSHLALPTAKRLAPADAQFWSAVGLASQQPWYVATFQVGVGAHSHQETICFSWGTELLRQIGAPTYGRLVDLLCLIPPWCAKTEHWSTRPIASVWLGKREDGAEIPVFVDRAGIEFCSDLLDIEPNDVHQRRLVVSVGPWRTSR